MFAFQPYSTQQHNYALYRLLTENYVSNFFWLRIKPNNSRAIKTASNFLKLFDGAQNQFTTFVYFSLVTQTELHGNFISTTSVNIHTFYYDHFCQQTVIFCFCS